MIVLATRIALVWLEKRVDARAEGLSNLTPVGVIRCFYCLLLFYLKEVSYGG